MKSTQKPATPDDLDREAARYDAAADRHDARAAYLREMATLCREEATQQAEGCNG